MRDLLRRMKPDWEVLDWLALAVCVLAVPLCLLGAAIDIYVALETGVIR